MDIQEVQVLKKLKELKDLQRALGGINKAVMDLRGQIRTNPAKLKEYGEKINARRAILIEAYGKITEFTNLVKTLPAELKKRYDYELDTFSGFVGLIEKEVRKTEKESRLRKEA